KQNQFGGVVGGAIIKNKLFYFVGEQSTIKRSNPANNTGFSMTPAMLKGDFSVIASTQCQPKAITLAAPWVNNVLPPTLLDPIAMKIAALLPTQGQQNGCGLITYATGGNQRQYQIPAKVDYALSSRQNLFVRYILSNNYTPLFYDPTNPIFTGSTTGQSNNIQSTAIGDTFTIKPNWV